MLYLILIKFKKKYKEKKIEWKSNMIKEFKENKK